MRIALFHNLPSGGGKRAVYEWMRRLVADHDIDVFTLSGADHHFCDIRPFAAVHRIYDFVPRRLFGPPWGRLNQLQRWLDLGRLAEIGQSLAAEIDAGSYQVVLANACQYSFIPTLIQYVQTPTLYYLHEPVGTTAIRRFCRPYLDKGYRHEIFNRYDPLIALYRQRLCEIQFRGISRAARLLANSRFTQIQMRQSFGVETPVCPLGVDCESFRPNPKVSKENHVISVGELSPRKGFDFLVESLGRIPPSKRPSLRLVCNRVDPDERDYLDLLAIQHGVKLEVLTGLHTAQLALEYNRARLCLCASVLEPFGLVPLEAMACSLAVVAIREAGLQESVTHGKTGLLVERDPSQFAEAVQYLLENPSLAAEFGRNGRQQCLLRWTWEYSVAELHRHLAVEASSRIGRH